MIKIVLLCFGDKHKSEALGSIQSLLRRLNYSSDNYEIVIVDNAHSERPTKNIDTSLAEISGDNAHREFSGYEVGLKYLKNQRAKSDDLVIVANDTFYRNYGNEYLNSIDRAELEKLKKKCGFMGWIDAYPEPVYLMSYEIKSWIRSSFIVGTFANFERLLPFTLATPNSYIFEPENYEKFFLDDAPISDNYARFIITWLFGETNENSVFRESWHSKTRINKNNFQELVQKCRCIFMEHLLSARVREFQHPVFDLRDGTWKLL
jgi:hypothetical protein